LAKPEKSDDQTIDESDATVTRGSGNVFADLGYADAEERQMKLRLAMAINEIIAAKRLSQTGTAGRLGVAQPKISALANYKLEEFSVERLMTFLTALDRDVEITIKKKPRSRRAGRVVVVAA
jgi:predicted XRE-type DNA-binding protein